MCLALVWWSCVLFDEMACFLRQTNHFIPSWLSSKTTAVKRDFDLILKEGRFGTLRAIWSCDWLVFKEPNLFSP